MPFNQQLNIGRITSRIFSRRKYKDLLFQRVFRDKKDLLDLYNALNGTSYTDAEELEITTLEDAIYMSIKNDVSFIVSSTLNLYEHQSTINPNMPLRGLLYFSRLYEAYIQIHKLDIYGGKLIPLPTPQYIVFYSGRQDIADETILKLSEAFGCKDNNENPVLECKARILNINYGHNSETLGACKRLNDYSLFIAKVNEGIDNKLPIKEAIENAIIYCNENDILSDILLKNRSEVLSMLLTEYDEKRHLKTVKQEGYDEGYQKGYEGGYNSRQTEVDELNSIITELKKELGRKKD